MNLLMGKEAIFLQKLKGCGVILVNIDNFAGVIMETPFRM